MLQYIPEHRAIGLVTPAIMSHDNSALLLESLPGGRAGPGGLGWAGCRAGMGLDVGLGLGR